ncbi:MAG: hypothetical protein GY803_28510, partial [Chloroflexi bacterium]|nr:hypothetical protein [Chloroflexota bacterium]
MQRSRGGRPMVAEEQGSNVLRFTFYVLIVFLLLGLTLPAIAQDGSEDDNGLKKAVTDDDVNKIARVVYCPVCESTPL